VPIVRVAALTRRPVRRAGDRPAGARGPSQRNRPSCRPRGPGGACTRRTGPAG